MIGLGRHWLWLSVQDQRDDLGQWCIIRQCLDDCAVADGQTIQYYPRIFFHGRCGGAVMQHTTDDVRGSIGLLFHAAADPR